MCGLAHYLEDEGLATVVIALVREHAEKMQPPRALWVPFELGRPFGGPNNVELQREVLRAALSLLDRPATVVVLEDFVEDKLLASADEEWLSPNVESYKDVIAEAAGMMPGWENFRARTGRTSVGLSGLEPLATVEYIKRFLTDDPMPNPKGMAAVSRARFAVDDIKAFYLEAAQAEAGQSSSFLLNEWFWRQTLGGKMILDFQAELRHDEDKNRRIIAGSLVPAERSYQHLGRYR